MCASSCRNKGSIQKKCCPYYLLNYCPGSKICLDREIYLGVIKKLYFDLFAFEVEAVRYVYLPVIGFVLFVFIDSEIPAPGATICILISPATFYWVYPDFLFFIFEIQSQGCLQQSSSVSTANSRTAGGDWADSSRRICRIGQPQT